MLFSRKLNVKEKSYFFKTHLTNICLGVDIEWEEFGSLEQFQNQLDRALIHLVEKHPLLRCTVANNGEYVFQETPNIKIVSEVTDNFADLFAIEMCRPFESSLLRVFILPKSDSICSVFLIAPHYVIDGVGLVSWLWHILDFIKSSPVPNQTIGDNTVSPIPKSFLRRVFEFIHILYFFPKYLFWLNFMNPIIPNKKKRRWNF